MYSYAKNCTRTPTVHVTVGADKVLKGERDENNHAVNDQPTVIPQREKLHLL